MIRKIKQINGKDGKQCNDDEEEDHNSKKEEITDLTDNARITIVKSTNHQKVFCTSSRGKLPSRLPNLIIMISGVSTVLKEKDIAHIVTRKMITLGK